MPTSNQSHILYIANDPYEMESLAELLERENFRVSTAVTIEAARKILQESLVHLILIDINISAEMKEHSDLNLVTDPLYERIPKVAIVIDQDDPNNNTLKNTSSVIYISYKQDIERLEKLMSALKNI